MQIKFPECEKNTGAKTSGHSISPFLGLHDLDNGINGSAVGAVYGYWRGNYPTNERISLNVGLGWTVHKDRLVRAGDVNEGQRRLRAWPSKTTPKGRTSRAW